MHVMVDNVSIIYEEGHIICNQNATEYGDFLQAYGSMVFKLS